MNQLSISTTANVARLLMNHENKPTRYLLSNTVEFGPRPREGPRAVQRGPRIGPLTVSLTLTPTLAMVISLES